MERCFCGIAAWLAVALFAAEPSPEQLAAAQQKLKGADLPAVVEALSELGGWGPSAKDTAPALALLLEHPNEEVAAYAAITLVKVVPGGGTGTGARLNTLIRRVRAGTNQSHVLKFCLVALANTAVDEAEAAALGETLSDLTGDGRFRDSENLAQAWAALGPAAVEPLRKLAGGENARARRVALYGMAMLGPLAKAAQPEALALLDSTDSNLRHPAVAAAVAMDPTEAKTRARIEQVFALANKAGATLEHLDETDRTALFLGLRCGGEAGVPWIMKALQSEAADFQRSCASRLDAWLPERADALLPVLLKRLETPAQQTEALRILGEMKGGARRALPALDAATAREPGAERIRTVREAIAKARDENPLAKD